MNIARNIRNLHQIHHSYIYASKYKFLTPIDKPIYSLALTSYHEFSAELMIFPYLQTLGQISPQISVTAGGILARIGIQLICATIRGMKYKSENNMKNIDYSSILHGNPTQVLNKIQDQRWLMKWIHKIFIIDSIRDYKFYGKSDEKINSDINYYYRPGNIIASCVNIYLSLNFLRGANYLITNPQYTEFCANTAYLANLSVYDPNFITPLLVLPTSYLILRYSKHPLMINLSHKMNLLHSFNIAFMLSLALIPVPGIYHFAIMGLQLGHLGCNYLKFNLHQLNRLIKRIIKLKN